MAGSSTKQNQPFDEVYWQNLVKDKQYNESGFIPPKITPKSKELDKGFKLSKPIKYGILLIALLALIVALYFIVKMIKSSKNEAVKNLVVENFELESLASIGMQEFDREINASINQGEFRLAFRWRFLKLLKYLEEKNLLRYKPEKTNSNYLDELKESAVIYPAFAMLCKKFDPIWYGQKILVKEEYLALEEYFKICEKELDLI